MVSDFRKKKYLHIFNSFIDTNANGTIDKKDFDEATEKIAKLRGWKAEDAQYKVLDNTLGSIWTGIQRDADTDKNGLVSKEEWVSFWDAYAKNPTCTSDWLSLYCKFVFQVLDAGFDESIDAEEFSTLYAAFGLDKADAVAAFQKMSKGKATVTWAEFQELWKEYFLSEDVNVAGNYIFGKTRF